MFCYSHLCICFLIHKIKTEIRDTRSFDIQDQVPNFREGFLLAVNWKNAFSFQTWQDVATEIFWRATTRTKAIASPTWPLDDEKLRNTVIEWPCTYLNHKWLIHIQSGLARLVHLKISDIPQPGGSIAIMHLNYEGTKWPVAIDFSDYIDINQAVASVTSVYFKMQFREEGYRFQNVVPGGYVPNSIHLYSYFPSLRKIQTNKKARFDATGRFSLEFAKGVRQKVLSQLSEQTEFDFQGSTNPVRYSRFLREVAMSRICIDLPGNGDFCFRLIDYLAVGACIIGVRHQNRLHVPLEDRKHIVYVKDDLSDLVELCRYYLEHDEERKRLCRNSREYFDRYLHRDQLAAYYLDCCFKRINLS